MNFLAIYNEIADELDDDRQTTIYNADLSTLTQTVRRRRNTINQAYTMVVLWLNRKSESREGLFTFNTVKNTEAYNIPSGVLNIDQLTVNTDPPIGIIAWPNYERYKADTLLITVTGTPTMAAIYQRQIWLWPVPDSAYVVNGRGQSMMTELNLDGDVPNLPADYHRCIRELALYYEMAYEGNPRSGSLSVSENGAMSAQGGQAARALEMLKVVKNNSKDHFIEPPRMIGIAEKRRTNAIRRIVKS